MQIMKFGGTSVENTVALRRLADIVRQNLDHSMIIVVSAMGKTTNKLLECGRQASLRNLSEARRILVEIAIYHINTLNDVASEDEKSALKAEITSRFELIDQLLTTVASEGELSPQHSDEILSNGELLSSSIVAAALRTAGMSARFVDVRPALVTNDDFTRAAVNFEIASTRLAEMFSPHISQGTIPVTQGFIGSTVDGRTTTIGRGGSDYSATIIGAALGATKILIWTDVDGILTTDPRIVPTAIKIRTISFAEAAELAYFGAKVLHPSTLLPAIKNEIPVIVCNSRRPELMGTMIVREAPATTAPVKAIAFKRGLTVVNVSSDRMLMAHGFLARLFEIFNRHETAIDLVSTSEVSVSMTLDDTRNFAPIVDELRQLGEVTIDNDQALICLVGENLKFTPGIAARVFSTISDINVSMISHGASSINLSFIVSEQTMEEAIHLLHRQFFSSPDPTTFEV